MSMRTIYESTTCNSDSSHSDNNFLELAHAGHAAYLKLKGNSSKSTPQKV